jgi:3-isopropylmalate/(R)-2-methylmalate dehydratase small subunit
MKDTITGKAYVLEDNIDTDQIIPAEHLVYSLTDAQESKKYGQYALSGVPVEKAGLPDGNKPFVSNENHLSEYKIIIAGANFGCGSSREHAPFALYMAGVQVIVAESYARIFYRNAIDGGFVIPLEATEKINDKINTGDSLKIDLENYTIENETSGATFQLRAPGDVLPIIDAGGIFEYARKTGMIK